MPAVKHQAPKLFITVCTPGKKHGRARNAPKFDLRERMLQMFGVDLSRIDGVDVTTALVVVSEAGADLSRFPSAKHFANWFGLSPGHQDQRRQAAERAHAAQRQPCGPGPAPGGSGSAHQPVGAGRV